MSPQITHPLVDSYLRDLELLLHGIDPGERAEVMAGVHEHLDGSLAPGADDSAVRAALAELGPPQAIADEAYAGRPAPSPVPAVAARPGPMSRGWVPVTVGVLLGLALLVTVLVIGSLGSYSTSDSLSSDGSTVVDPGPEVAFSTPGPGGVLIGLLASWIFWVPATILVLSSPLWTNRQKVVLSLLTPLALVVMIALPTIGWESSHTELGINLGAWTSLALVVGGGAWVLTRLCRGAARKTAT